MLVASCGASAPPPVSQAPISTLSHQGVVTLEGERTELGHVTEGRVALVSLWATWCEACTKEVDAMNRLAKKTADRHDALVVGVAVGESPSSVDAFVRRHGMTYLQLVDEDFSLADALGQRNVPATLVIDRRGRVVYRGDVLDSAGLSAFRKALEGAP
jgi:peroxiredoxin